MSVLDQRPASVITRGRPATGVERREGLDHRAFLKEYVMPLRPVVLGDALRDCRAVGKWTPEFFGHVFGDQMVTVAGQSYRLRDLISLILDSTESRPAPYLHLKVPTGWSPNLFDDLTPRPRCVTPNWAELAVFRRLRLAHPEVLIGGRGTRFPVMHWDMFHMHAFLLQFSGEKRFVLFSPDQTTFLYSDPKKPARSLIANPDKVDTTRFPLFSRARATECVLGVGDTLFIPAGWWHTTEILTPCTTVNFNTVTGCNWSVFVRDVLALEAQRRSRPAISALAAYLRAVGTLRRLTQPA